MADVHSLSPAHTIVLAIDLCSKEDFEGLGALQQLRSDVLGAELCCRILLTFVSGNEDPSHYVPLLRQIRGFDAGDATEKSIDMSGVDGLSEADARKRVRQMRLERLKSLGFDHPGADDVIARFLIQQGYRIDAETGDLPTILQLVEPFIDDNEFLRRWLISSLLPLLRLDYEYYSDGGSGLSFDVFHDLEGSEGLDILLQRARIGEGKLHIGRDLRGIVGPWMYGSQSSKRRKVSHSFRRASTAPQDGTSTNEESVWQDVNEWIVKTSLEDHDLAVKAICDWDGPRDVDLGGYEDPAHEDGEEGNVLSLNYGQAALATVYTADEASSETLRDSWRILERVKDITQLDSPKLDSEEDHSLQPENIAKMPRTALSLDALLEPDHPLTLPSTESLHFLEAVLRSIQILKNDLHSQQQLSCRNATTLCLYATDQMQRQELHKTLQNFARIAPLETDWRLVRERMLWLSRWKSKGFESRADEDNHSALFWRVPLEDVETEIFNAMLTAKQYKTTIELYLADTSPIPIMLVEKLVEHEILNAYDNASNGNRTRGGMKRASEILKAFVPHFSPSSPVNKIEHLLAATHSLSFYHLTLQHGVPFQPVSIRVHHDPISLISKVLEQNSKAYTKLDDLLSIGRGFVAAGLPTSSSEDKDELTALEDDLETKMLESDHRIIYDAIISALSNNDFDTAYSYILTRLSPSSTPQPSGPIDDTSWRAAYAAGRHRPPSSSSTSSSAQITTLSKRMELLSLSLALVPNPAHLPSMLQTWQACEAELNALRAREAAEEQAWDDRGDNISSLPGGFGLEDRDRDLEETRREQQKRTAKSGRAKGRWDEEEAPMGLFDVARGAARAIGKSAFPLRGVTQNVKVGDAPPSPRASDEYARSTGSGEHERVRKRDMVSNMVTGGLVSGLGWVLGAQPVGKESASTSGAHGQGGGYAGE